MSYEVILRSKGSVVLDEGGSFKMLGLGVTMGKKINPHPLGNF